MKLHLSIVLSAVLVLLASCGPQQNFSSDKEKFEAFLKNKRVPLNDEARYERLLEDFNRRTAIANQISNTDLLDNTLIDAEVEEFRKELLISRYFERYLEENVTDQGVQNYYNNNVDSYKSRKIKVSHILFRLNPRMDESERQVVLTKASEAYSKVNSGESFEETAQALSEDKVSGAKGGDLGWLNEGAISDEFSEKVFSMQAGQVSEPFLTDYGFHVIKVTEAAQDVIKPFEAIKGDIRYQLRNESKQAEMDRLSKAAGISKKG